MKTFFYSFQSSQYRLCDSCEIAGSNPVGSANSKQKNCPYKAVFLLNTVHFRVKTRLKNSYAPRVPLPSILVRTRDFITHIATV